MKLRILLLITVLMTLVPLSWYGVNYYAAGLLRQELLIEFGMEEDFDYCTKPANEMMRG